MAITGLGMHSFHKNPTFLRSFAFFSKECNVLAFFKNRMQHSLHSFTFFIKERCVLCVLLHSLLKNRHSLHSFTFFIKECGVICVLLRSL